MTQVSDRVFSLAVLPYNFKIEEACDLIKNADPPFSESSVPRHTLDNIEATISLLRTHFSSFAVTKDCDLDSAIRMSESACSALARRSRPSVSGSLQEMILPSAKIPEARELASIFQQPVGETGIRAEVLIDDIRTQQAAIIEPNYNLGSRNLKTESDRPSRRSVLIVHTLSEPEPFVDGVLRFTQKLTLRPEPHNLMTLFELPPVRRLHRAYDRLQFNIHEDEADAAARLVATQRRERVETLADEVRRPDTFSAAYKPLNLLTHPTVWADIQCALRSEGDSLWLAEELSYCLHGLLKPPTPPRVARHFVPARTQSDSNGAYESDASEESAGTTISAASHN